MYAHAFIPCDLKPGTDSREVNVVLRRGMTVTGRVVGPDGQPVARPGCSAGSSSSRSPGRGGSLRGQFHGDVHDGRCELHGLAPDAEVPVFFLDPNHKLVPRWDLSGKSIALMTIATSTGRVEVGATVRFSGESRAAGRSPSGSSPAARPERVVDPSGKPLAAYRDPSCSPWSSRPDRTG